MQMKSVLTRAVLCAAVLTTAFTVTTSMSAQAAPPRALTDIESSAPASIEVRTTRIQPEGLFKQSAISVTATQAVVQVYKITLPWKDVPAAAVAQQKAMQDWLSGSIGTRTPTGPDDYTVVTGPTSWFNYMVGIGYQTWGGTNPPANSIYSGQHGTPIAYLVIVNGMGGGVSMSMLRTKCASPQDPQINQVLQLTNRNYGVTALGRNNDGSINNSGPSTDLVDSFAVVIYPQLYGASNDADALAIKSYILDELGGTYAQSLMCDIIAHDVVIGSMTSTASTAAITRPPLPALAIVLSYTAIGSQSVITLSVPDAVQGRSYGVATSTNSPGPWALVPGALAKGTQMIFQTRNPQGYYRLQSTD